LQRTDAELAAKQTQLRQVEEEIARQQDLLASVQQKLGTGSVDDAKELILTADLSNQVTPRIYIQVRSKEQLDIAHALAQNFKAKGYAVPKAEILVNQGPKKTEVRYFHRTNEEKEEATRIAGDIGPEVTAQFIPGSENSPLVKPRQYEVWLAPAS
jgi:hypothetical protein